jgi:hypothetical protein
LQILPQPFAKYLYENDFKTVLLCTEHLDIVQCSVITRGPLQNCVEITYGWKQYCQLQGYQAGQNLRFKAGGQFSGNLFRVIKIDN